jgi:O-antigen/teichoic acid export membrane protein
MEKSIFKNAIYKMTLNFFNLILPLLIGPYVYRTLGADSVGKVKFAESIFNYFFIFASFGIYQYGLREVSRVKHDKEKVAKLFTSLFTLSLLTNFLTLIVYVAVSYIGYKDSYLFPILLIFSLNFIMNVFYVEWMNEAFESYDFITLKTVAVKIVYLILLFMLVKNAGDYLLFTALLVVSTSLNNIISFIYIKRKVKFNFKDISIVPHLKPLFLVVIFLNGNILYSQLDIFMLGQYVSEKDVSFYFMCKQMISIVSALMLSVVQVTIPRLSFLLGGNDEETYVSLVRKVCKIYFMILFPAAVGLILISDVGVVAYGGKEFLGAAPVLEVFSVYMVILGIDSILANQVIYVKQKEHILVRFIIACGLINLLLNAISVYLGVFSAEVAVATTAVATFILISLEYYYVTKKLGIKLNLFSFSNMKYLLYSLIFIPVSYFIRSIITDTYALFVVLILVNMLIYGSILVVTKDEMLYVLLDKVKVKMKKQ